MVHHPQRSKMKTKVAREYVELITAEAEKGNNLLDKAAKYLTVETVLEDSREELMEVPIKRKVSVFLIRRTDFLRFCLR